MLVCPGKNKSTEDKGHKWFYKESTIPQNFHTETIKHNNLYLLINLVILAFFYIFLMVKFKVMKSFKC